MKKKSKAALKLEAAAQKAFENNPYEDVTFSETKSMPSLRGYKTKPIQPNPADSSGPRPMNFLPLDQGDLIANSKY